MFTFTYVNGFSMQFYENSRAWHYVIIGDRVCANKVKFEDRRDAYC